MMPETESRSEHVARLIDEFDRENAAFFFGYIDACLAGAGEFTVKDLENCVSSVRSADLSRER